MSLQKLAKELDETARQSSSMLEGITEALDILGDDDLVSNPAIRDAVQIIITAIQGQDRIEQRCRNMALAVRQFALLPASASVADYEEIWSGLTLDELRVPALSGVATVHPSHGEVELF